MSLSTLIQFLLFFHLFLFHLSLSLSPPLKGSYLKGDGSNKRKINNWIGFWSLWIQSLYWTTCLKENWKRKVSLSRNCFSLPTHCNSVFVSSMNLYFLFSISLTLCLHEIWNWMKLELILDFHIIVSFHSISLLEKVNSVKVLFQTRIKSIEICVIKNCGIGGMEAGMNCNCTRS